MAAQKLLLPYNFSESDRKALDFTVSTFGHRDDIEVTIFHAHTPLPSVDVSSETVTGRLTEYQLSESESVRSGNVAAGNQSGTRPARIFK